MLVNVIQNGDFSDGLTGWVSSGSPDTGGSVVDDPLTPGNPVLLLGDETRKAQGPFPVQPGDVWRLMFRLISGRSIQSFGIATSNSANWAPKGAPAIPSTGGVWSQVDFTVTIPADGSVTSIWVRFATGDPPDFYVDDVALYLIERGGVPVLPVKARDDVTLAAVTDVDYARRYYLLQASTLEAPAAPTVNPPGGDWVTAEPTYTEGSTNSLYTVDLTVFSDGTFDYSVVSLSSSYEASKTAYNKAVAAQSAATSAANQATAQYGTCTTAAATAAKVVTLSNFALFTGATITVAFTNANTVANPTLNVNGTGAKSIRSPANAALTASSPYNWAANARVQFAYDGTYWRQLSASDAASLGGTAASTIATNINTSLLNAKVFVQVDAPSATKAGDVWFPVNADGDVIGMRYSTAAGTANWSPYVIIAADIMVAGEGGTIRLKDNTVTAGTVVASEALLQKILVRTLSAAEIDVVSLVAAILTGQIFKTSGYDSGTGVLIDNSGIRAIDETGEVSLSGSGLMAGTEGSPASVAILPSGQFSAVGGTFTGGLVRISSQDSWETTFQDSFESGLTGWTTFSNDGVTPLSIVTDAAHSGTHALRMGKLDFTTRAIRTFPVSQYPLTSGNLPVQANVWVYFPEGLDPTFMYHVYLSWVAYTQDNSQNSTVLANFTSQSPTPAGWRKFTLNAPPVVGFAPYASQLMVTTGIQPPYGTDLPSNPVWPDRIDDVELYTPVYGTMCQIAVVDGFPGIQWYNADNELQGRIQIPDSGTSGIGLESGRASTSEPLQRVNVSADEANLVSVNTATNEVLASVAANKDGVVTIAGDTRIDLVAPGITATPEVATSGVTSQAPDANWSISFQRYASVAGVHTLNLTVTRLNSSITISSNSTLVCYTNEAFRPPASWGEIVGSFKGSGAAICEGSAGLDCTNGTTWLSTSVSRTIPAGGGISLSFTWIE